MGQAARRIDCNGVSAMLCKFSMLRRKEVINLCDGSRLGFVGDLDIQVPEGTVKSRLNRAKAQLKDILSKSGNLFGSPSVIHTETQGKEARP